MVGRNCFFCGDDKSNLVFYRDHIKCEVLGYINKRKNHYLEGRLLSKEIDQTENEVISSNNCQMYMPLKSIINFDISVGKEIFYANGFNYICGECNEENGISNLGKIGEEFSCRKCKKIYFRIEEETKVEMKKTSNK